MLTSFFLFGRYSEFLAQFFLGLSTGIVILESPKIPLILASRVLKPDKLQDVSNGKSCKFVMLLNEHRLNPEIFMKNE